MSDVRIFKAFGDSPRPGPRSSPAPSQTVELVSDLEPSERIDERLTRLEHVPGNGVWAKRRALGEGNSLGLIRGQGGAGCSYIIQARVPDPALQPALVRRIENEDEIQKFEAQARSWADNETEQDEAEQETMHASMLIRLTPKGVTR